MPEEQNQDARRKERYDHITIGLQCRVHETWEAIRAHGWNDVGFNFYLNSKVTRDSLDFKKGAARFEGKIMWNTLNTNDDVILVTIVNELLYKQTGSIARNGALHSRLVKLIRTPWMISEKRNLLASLGVTFTDAAIHEMIDTRKKENPMFRYGVKVESEAWNTIVKKALSISSAVMSLEKVKDALKFK